MTCFRCSLRGFICKGWSEKIAVVVLFLLHCLCLNHKELNEKVIHDLVQVRAERVKWDLVHIRTTYDSISWL